MDPWVQTYRAITTPWNRIWSDAPVVMTLRLMQMPWLALTDTTANDRENKKMVSEKVAAFHEFQQAAVLAPMRFWFDLTQSMMTGQYANVFNKTLTRSSTHLAKPYTSRVSSNRRRLSKPR